MKSWIRLHLMNWIGARELDASTFNRSGGYRGDCEQKEDGWPRSPTPTHSSHPPSNSSLSRTTPQTPEWIHTRRHPPTHPSIHPPIHAYQLTPPLITGPRPLCSDEWHACSYSDIWTTCHAPINICHAHIPTVHQTLWPIPFFWSTSKRVPLSRAPPHCQ